MRGVAWTAPVIAVATAAPAFAVSLCTTTRTLNWASLGNGSVFTSTTVGGCTITLTLTGNTAAANNATVFTGKNGDQDSSLRLYSELGTGISQVATLAFSYGSQPAMVKDLTFSLLDIDSVSTTNPTQTYNDRVGVEPAGFGYTITNTTQLEGAGRVGNPTNDFFRPQEVNSPVANTSTAGNVKISYSGLVDSVSIQYRQYGTATGSGVTPMVGISNLTFTPVIC